MMMVSMTVWRSGSSARLAIAGALLVGLTLPLAAQPQSQSSPPADATLRSTPETVLWGYFAGDAPPVLRIKSGQTVRIDTVSHSGMTTAEDPVTFFGEIALLRRTKRSGTVTAVRKTRLLALDAQDFHALIERLPALKEHVTATAEKRLAETLWPSGDVAADEIQQAEPSEIDSGHRD